ncbi:Sugar phosphate isomerase/epimerase [Chitinophaga costaii]|uniref:Sugar phosphate isomerase/epimerase n=1 Tax=Chitinophaga costaii TaxID=1335309 RepID=A0A1C4CNI0_9BACT|nr:sugar phosphate isomerase/epimerase [Chitinophaga costaii]PUZ27017.1 sugar phosphate isomerase/epimerase [Chitinophaga costaii]SCC20655.1 Sugar phosphate isomerase/epimerase [Chitinophaga costaii]
MTTRRDFLRSTTLLSAAALLAPRLMANAASTKTLIGLQLYTLRDDAIKDIKGTIAAIQQAGYTNLELFGYNKRLYFGLSVKDFSALLKAHQLKTTSAHYGLHDFLSTGNEEELKYVIEDAKILGHDFVTIPYLQDSLRTTADNFKQLADRFNKAGQLVNAAGMKLAYHNHNFEFTDYNGTTGYEILLSNTDPKLVHFEMDIYWVVYAGIKPLDLFKQHPGRFPMWHIKDMRLEPQKESCEVGKGVIDFKDIFKYKKEAGFENFFVEQEAYTAAPPKDAIITSINYIKKNLV